MSTRHSTFSRLSRTFGSVIALGVVLSLLSTACGGSESSSAGGSGEPVSGGSLTWGVETEPTTLNPQLNGQDKTKLLLRNAYESLLYRESDGSYVPWLARSYEISTDQKTYTYTLRDDVVFHDGQKLDAAAIVKNFTEFRNPAYNTSGASGPASHIADAQAVSPDVVRITLTAPWAPFLDWSSGFEILSPSAYSSPDVKAGGPSVAGTGPFVLDRYAKGQEVHFTKFDKYNWAPANAGHQGPAYLDEVTYRFLAESSVRVGALTSGQVDVIEGVPGIDAAQFDGNDEFSYATALNTGTPYSLYFNSIYGPTADERVRKAFRDAVDLDGVLNSVYRGKRTRAWSAVSPADPDYYDSSLAGTYGNDVAEANRLLDEAGWTARDAEGFRVKDGQRLTITDYQSQPYVRDQRDVLLQAIQAQVKQNAGIDFAVQLVDPGTATQHRSAKDYGTYDNSNTSPDGVDIEYHWLPVDRGGSINLSFAADPQLSEWLAAAAATTDKSIRRDNYVSLQKFVITDKAYSFPLYEPEDQIAAASYVHGTGFRPFRQLPERAYDVWIDKS